MITFWKAANSFSIAFLLWNVIITIIKYQSKLYCSLYAKIPAFIFGRPFANFFNSKVKCMNEASYLLWKLCLSSKQTVIWDINYLFRSFFFPKSSIWLSSILGIVIDLCCIFPKIMRIRETNKHSTIRILPLQKRVQSKILVISLKRYYW